MTHNESLTFYWCLWNLSVPLHLSFFYFFPVTSRLCKKTCPPSTSSFFLQTLSLSFQGKHILTHLFASDNLILSPFLSHLPISLCLILGRWGHLSRNIIYHTHLTSSHPVALTEICWGDDVTTRCKDPYVNFLMSSYSNFQISRSWSDMSAFRWIDRRLISKCKMNIWLFYMSLKV